MAKHKFKDFVAVLDLWSSRTLLAHRLTIKPNTVIRWAYSNNIPPNYWRSICAVSKGRVRIDDMLDLAEARGRIKPKINNEPRHTRQEFVTA